MAAARSVLRFWATILWAGVAIWAVAFVVLGQSLWLAAIPIVSAALAQIYSTHRERRQARLERLSAQIEGLYGPQVARAKSLLEAPPGSEGGFHFRDQMERVLGELQGHLAEDSTLAAFNIQDHSDRWARNLARVFVADHRRLVEEYRRLVR